MKGLMVKLFNSDCLLHLYKYGGYKSNISIIFNARMTDILRNYYVGQIINDLNIKDRLINGEKLFKNFKGVAHCIEVRGEKFFPSKFYEKKDEK